MQPQQATADRVKGPCPRQVGVARDPLRAANHLLRRASRERQQKDPPRVRAVDHELRDPAGQRRGFSRSRARDDQERRIARAADRRTLRRVEGRERVDGSLEGLHLTIRTVSGLSEQLQGDRNRLGAIGRWRERALQRRFRAVNNVQIPGQNHGDRCAPTCAIPGAHGFQTGRSVTLDRAQLRSSATAHRANRSAHRVLSVVPRCATSRS